MEREVEERGTICFDNNASEAEVKTDTKKSRKVNNQIHRRPEQNAKYWIYLSATQKRILADRVWAIIMYQSTLEECVVKVVKKDGNENCSQKTTWASKGQKVTLRNTWAHRTPTFQVCLGKPRVICRRGNLTQFHQRVAIDRTSACKELKNSSLMLSRHRRIISLPKSSKRSTRRYIFMSILDHFQLIQ